MNPEHPREPKWAPGAGGTPKDPKQPSAPPQAARKTRPTQSAQTTPVARRRSRAQPAQPAGRDPPPAHSPTHPPARPRATQPAAPPDRAARHEAAYRRLGTRQPKCQRCTETDPLALQGVAPDLLCAECAARQVGRSPTEKHHVAGQHNDPTKTPIPTNDHKVLSDQQRDWPTATLRNREGSPLLQAAGALRGWLDVLRLIIERTVGWIPDMLEALDTW